MPKKLISQMEYARHRGCSHRAVQKAMENGRITFVIDKYGHRKIPDIEQADKEWALNTNHERKRIPTRGQRERGVDTVSGVMDEAGDEPETIRGLEVKKEVKKVPRGGIVNDEKSSKFSTARAVREGFDAKLKQLKYEKELKLVVNSDMVDKFLFSMGKTIMENMLNISPRVADELAATNTAFDCRQILDKEIRQVLEDTIAEGIKVPRE